MKKVKLPLLTVFLLTSSYLFSQWVSLTKNAVSAPPEVRVIQQSPDETVFTVRIDGFTQKDINIKGETYRLLDLQTEAFTHIPGAPKVPVVSAVIAVPDHAPVQAQVVASGERSYFQDMNIPPARESWWENSEKESEYIKDAAYYNQDAFFPQTDVKLDTPQVFRDFRIVRVELHPVKYNPVTKQVQVINSFTVKLTYDGHGEVVNPRTAPVRAIAPSFDKIYKSLILNYEQMKQQTRGTLDEGQDLMLCIMPDEFYDSFLPYADWKRRSGINVVITKFSDIGANSSNPVLIRNYIANAYHNWEVPPTYVLVVGDKGVFPVKYISYDYTFVYDDYFVEIDGNDYFPEMMIGRFTNQGDYRMRVMINKFQMYEETPYMDDTSWFMKGICCSNDEYESQVTTKVYCRDLMLNQGGFTSVDAMMSDSDFGCTHDVNDVINALNEGRSYLNYRGEGWSYGWWASCTPFHTDDVAYLNNGQKFTFFTSIGCGVAMFDEYGGNCFGEALVQKGTLSNPSGAIAFVGPTSNTHTQYNNQLDKGIYKGMFIEHMDTPGEALLRGKLFMYNVFGGSDQWVEYTYRVFHVLGDPSIHIWKKVPRYINVDHAPNIVHTATSTNISVSYQDDDSPAVGARVTLTGDNGFFAMGITDENGNVTVENLDATGLTQYHVTVTGKDVYPYEGTMDIFGMGTDDYVSAAGVQVYPNPFGYGSGQTFVIDNSQRMPVHIIITNLNGQIVNTLHDENRSEKTELYWSGTNAAGTALSPGIYFARIITGNNSRTVKLILK